jgi:HTH-type transcriptional regulator, competence development regulator
MKFGDYMKNLREEKSLSQRQLAELARISNTEISRIESGERINPSPSILKAVAPYLGVTYEELLQKAGYIEEVIDHHGFTENIYIDEDGNLVDIVKKAKVMFEKNRKWAEVAFRVSDENLSESELDLISDQTEKLLEHLLKNRNK